MKLKWRDVAVGTGPAISTSVTVAETQLLRRLSAGAAELLEVGSGFGYSAVVMAHVDATLTAVDPHAKRGALATIEANLAAHGVAGWVRVDQRPSHVALPEYVDAGRRFGLIFIDGDHTESTVMHDVTWACKLLAPGGVLACHDYGEDTCPGVRAALDRLLGPPPELVDTLAIYRDLA